MPPKVLQLIPTHFLLKAEPETRLVNGIDVKFSAQDFEAATTTNWDGVRNHQAKNILRDQIKLKSKCLFYASNTKVPGIVALSYCSKEGFPDHNAWDPKHPYYDEKSRSEDPTWFMVELTFVAHLPHLVSLKLLQHLATLSDPPACLPYLTKEHLEAIAAMALLSRGRLSVQPVQEMAYDAIVELGMKGGWESIDLKKKVEAKIKVKRSKDEEDEDEQDEIEREQEEEDLKPVTKKSKNVSSPKAAVKKEVKKEVLDDVAEASGRRRSMRRK